MQLLPSDVNAHLVNGLSEIDSQHCLVFFVLFRNISLLLVSQLIKMCLVHT